MPRSHPAPAALSLAAGAAFLFAFAACDAGSVDPLDGAAAAGTSAAALGSAPEAAPPPIPPVVSATDLGVVREHPAINGRDGAISALVNGRSVWTFGDTPLNVPGADGDRWADNTLAWTADLDASDGLSLDGNHLDRTGAPTEFVPLTPEEREYNRLHDTDNCQEEPCGAEFAIWPGDIVPDPARERALVFYYELWRIPGVTPGWRGVGSGIAVWDGERRVERPILNPGSETPTLMWGPSETAYTNASLVVGEDLYAYGCNRHWIEHRCKVARVPLAQVLDKSAWRYYTGERWSASPRDAVNLFTGGAAGTSVFYVPYLDQFMAVYSAAFSNDILYRVSRTPWGPWSEAALMFTGRPGWQGNTNYTGHAHPEFAEDGGRVQYVTYAHTTGFLRFDLPLHRVVFGDPQP